MRNALIVHDDMLLSRVAHQIEDMAKSIELFESIINGTCTVPRYRNVDKREVYDLLELERLNLAVLIEDIENGLLENELKEMKKRYVSANRTEFFPALAKMLPGESEDT